MSADPNAPAEAATPREQERAARRAQSLARKQHAAVLRAQKKQAQADRREAERVAREQARAAAWASYTRVRPWAERLRATAPPDEALTADERRIQAALEPLWDADLETIALLRHACGAITGVDAADYAPPSDDLVARLRRELLVLRKQMGPELFIQESPVLGGFGLVRGDERYNDDTMRWFHVLSALQDGALLPAFRATTTRRLVWEIGGGWGGFAFTFKTLCPNTTYVITGLPETLLVAAIYLINAFPQAAVRLHGERGTGIWDEWEQADFILAPEGTLPAPQAPLVDLTLDIGALRQMTPRRVTDHVRRAYDAGARYFYSMLPAERAAADAPLVWSAIERWFWPHPVPPRGPAGITYPPPPGMESGFAHLAGWRRMRP